MQLRLLRRLVDTTWVLDKNGIMVRTGFSWLRIMTSGGIH
jgi:hypothetical protein